VRLTSHVLSHNRIMTGTTWADAFAAAPGASRGGRRLRVMVGDAYEHWMDSGEAAAWGLQEQPQLCAGAHDGVPTQSSTSWCVPSLSASAACLTDCLTDCLPACLPPACLPACLSVRLPECLLHSSWPACVPASLPCSRSPLHARPSTHPRAHLPDCLPANLRACLANPPGACLPAWLPVCQPAHPIICLLI
jgi:hypothetical protein